MQTPLLRIFNGIIVGSFPPICFKGKASHLVGLAKRAGRPYGRAICTFSGDLDPPETQLQMHSLFGLNSFLVRHRSSSIVELLDKA